MQRANLVVQPVARQWVRRSLTIRKPCWLGKPKHIGDSDVTTIDRSSVVYIAGHSGLVGSAIWRYLEQESFTNLIGISSAELDLVDRNATLDYVQNTRPDVIIEAAARVGGIMANSTNPAGFLSDNILIQTNLMDAAAAANVDRFLFLGSSCIYPKFAAQPIREDSLMT